ncbi:MAG: ATP-binding protein [Myxococcota bacterium]
MNDICVLGGADVHHHRTGAPRRHLLDETPGALHLGVLVGGRVVGAVSGFPIHPTGAFHPKWMQLYGPFGDHGDALVDALVERVGPGVTVWSESARPRFEDVDHGRRQRVVPEPERPAVSSGDEYSIDSIQVLEGLEAVRLRPGMYVGSTGKRGIEVLALEGIGNVVDEHLAGHAQTLWVDRSPDGMWTIADDGRGIPVDWPDILERIVGTLHASGSTGRRHVHLGLHGLGLSVVNALSDTLLITVDRAGFTWEQLFRRGHTVTPRIRLAPSARTGTTLRFRPDREIFDEALALGELMPILRRVAMLNPRLAVFAGGHELSMPGGLLAGAKALATSRVVDHLGIDERHDDVEVRLAVLWTDGPDELRAELHANQLLLESGTVHDAVREAFEGQSGVVVVGDVGLFEPHFAGRTKAELASSEAGAAVREVLGRALAER